MNGVQRFVWLPQADAALLRQATIEREDLSSQQIMTEAIRDILPRLEEPAIRERIAAYKVPELDHQRELRKFCLPQDLDGSIGQQSRELKLDRDSITVVAIQLCLERMMAEA